VSASLDQLCRPIKGLHFLCPGSSGPDQPTLRTARYVRVTPGLSGAGSWSVGILSCAKIATRRHHGRDRQKAVVGGGTAIQRPGRALFTIR